MKSYQGSGMEVVGQTKFFLQIQTRRGYTTKKMLHCLVIDKAYDNEILISWDNCILMGIIPESFPYCFLEEDLESESKEENVEKEKEEENTENEEESKNRRTKEVENPELFKQVLNQAIANIESKDAQEKNKKIAEDMKKKYLKKYRDVFKEKLERGDKVKCPPVRIETIKGSRIKPINCRTPVPVPAHYRKSADKQIRDFLRAGIIERCHHHTPWLSSGLFISKKQEKDSKELKV